MSTAEQILPTNLVQATRPRRTRIFRRALLCLTVGAVEGVTAGTVIVIAALAYHLFVLRTPDAAFPWLLYLGFAALAGLVYAATGAIDCGRFLESRERRQAGLTNSFYCWTIAFALALLSAFLAGRIGDLSRVSLTSAYGFGVPALLLLRSGIQELLNQRIGRGELHYERVAVIGNRVDVLAFLLGGNLWRHGHALAGTLYFEDVRDLSGHLRSERVAEFASDVLHRGSKHILMVGSLGDLEELAGLVLALKRYALDVLYAPVTRHGALAFLDVVPLGPARVLRLIRNPLSDYAVMAKRALDLVGASAGLVLLSPLLAIVALAIVLDSPGPVIYRQARRGFNGETFSIWKFRSMRVTESGYAMRQATANDPRITRIGNLLRRTSIDELPQLFNVLMGTMSLVGPRPHAISHDAELSRRVAGYADRQRIKPGITGWAQVNGFRGETSSHEQIEGRVLHDIYYIDNWSLLFDLWIIVLTIASPRTRRNAR